MTPLAVEGTSIAALSDSSVTSGVSTSMRSPGFTMTSMTATSLKPPRSGTRTSTTSAAAFMSRPSDLPGNRFRRIDAERLDGRRHRRAVDALLVGERLESCDGDVVAIDLEVAPQRGARVGASEPVGAERDVAAADPLADLIGHGAHVVGRGDHRAFAVLQERAHVGHARRTVRMQQVPA